MKTQIQITLCLSFVLLTSFTVAQTTFPIAVSLSGDQRDMQPDFFGFNGMRTTSNNLSWNDFTINNANSYWPVNPFHQFDLGHLRYPGGGVGNYWDFRKGWFLDQNQIPAEMELETPYNSAFPGSPTFDDRMNAFKTTSNLLNTTPLFCINKLSSDILYQKAMLYYAKENGLPLKYVELGSELYSTLRNNVLAYPTATHYA